MSEATRRNGQPCARCGMKDGAHNYRNPHPRACAAWRSEADLRDDREFEEDAWMIDPEMEAKG